MDISPKEIIQIDATIITGILILLTVSPFFDKSLVDQSLEGIVNPFQTYNELNQLNETETIQYISEFMKEQNKLNIQFFLNPILWAYAIGFLFSLSAICAIISMFPRKDLQVKYAPFSVASMMLGFMMFLVMFVSFAFFPIIN